MSVIGLRCLHLPRRHKARVWHLTKLIVVIFGVWGIMPFLFTTSLPQKCFPGEADSDYLNPGVYPDEVDLRIIVITFKRSWSLLRLLLYLDRLELDGDRAALEIWIDRDHDTNAVDCETLRVAREFEWSRGVKRVHLHRKHVGIYGQWIDTWRPRIGSNEIALILEDDLIVSPFAYRWIKAAHNKYGSRRDISGYTLQSEEVSLATGVGLSFRLSGPVNHTAFLYKRIGTWGFAPNPNTWRSFQDWFHEVHRNSSFHPYVKQASIITKWYKDLERKGRQDTMWSMWFVHFSERYGLFTVYNNLVTSTKQSHVLLAENAKESGLHFTRSWLNLFWFSKLMTSWSENYVRFPDYPVKYDWDGSVLQ